MSSSLLASRVTRSEAVCVVGLSAGCDWMRSLRTRIEAVMVESAQEGDGVSDGGLPGRRVARRDGPRPCLSSFSSAVVTRSRTSGRRLAQAPRTVIAAVEIVSDGLRS